MNQDVIARNIEIKRCKLRIQQLITNKMQMEIRIDELDEEKRRIQENFPSQEKEEKELLEQIKALIALNESVKE